MGAADTRGARVVSIDTLRRTIADLMPEVLDDLRSLVRIPSIAFPGYPEAPVHEAAARTAELARRAGFADVTMPEVPWGYPPVVGEIAGPPGSPTVVLYAHYDVQPAPPEQGWSADPWTPVTRPDGRIAGRGAADDKSGIAIHLATVRALGGRPPCTVRLIVEGMEETTSNLESFVQANPSMFEAEAFVVADMGNLEVGSPALTTTLRGEVSCIVTVRTLTHALHSGVFGGPAPDALMAMSRLLASLHDDAGDVAVDGLQVAEPFDGDVPEAGFRAMADVVDGSRLIGSGTIGQRLWCRPSISAIGLDATPIDRSSNVLVDTARAKLSMRIAPGSEPDVELEALERHLVAHVPWGARVEVERVKAARPFRCATDGPVGRAARTALREAFGRPPVDVGSGGTIPLLHALQAVSPDAEFILWGAEDMARSRIHASDESVDPEEIERLVLAQALFLRELADA
jgi:acetylornithine deacetylase/succinyl-diaminopimelate desuccinylase-like protein